MAAEVHRISEELFGNPSSLHGAGRSARLFLEECRERIGSLLGARSEEIIFTSGGTEANRLAVLGAIQGARSEGAKRIHAVVSSIDHPSTVDLVRQLEGGGEVEVAWVPAGSSGLVEPDLILEALRPETRLVSLIHSNNETGIIQDVAPVGAALRERGIPLHSDGVQSLGKIPLHLSESGADLVSLSAHKIGGPKGIGALWIRRGARFRAPFQGGPQERGWRPGTENLPAVAGFALAVERMEIRGSELRDRLLEILRDRIDGMVLNGDPRRLLPNTANVSFPGIASELLLIGLDLEGVAASSGAACSSGARKPSHVLQAMGLSRELVESAVRFSLGWTTTREEIDRAAEIISRSVLAIRSGVPQAPRDGAASLRTAPGTSPSGSGTPLGAP